MAPDLGLTSLAPFPNSNQAQTQIPMWNNNNHHHHDDDEDSWEVRAFEEDTTGNLLGSTWPPRSYTCSFCRREFRSAQALGGHMNVHRRDRARLHEVPPPPTAILIPTPVANGLCLLYPLPANPNSIIFPNPPPTENYSSSVPHFKPTETAPNSVVSSLCHSTNTDPSPSNSNGAVEEELDLELRLGRRPPPPP